MSNAKNNEQVSHVSSLSNIPTHSSSGRKLSRSERRKIERDQRKIRNNQITYLSDEKLIQKLYFN